MVVALQACAASAQGQSQLQAKLWVVSSVWPGESQAGSMCCSAPRPTAGMAPADLQLLLAAVGTCPFKLSPDSCVRSVLGPGTGTFGP